MFIILISARLHHHHSHVVICDPLFRHTLVDWRTLHHRLEYSTLFVTKLLRHSSLSQMLLASPIYTPQRGDRVVWWLCQIPNSSSPFLSLSIDSTFQPDVVWYTPTHPAGELQGKQILIRHNHHFCCDLVKLVPR